MAYYRLYTLDYLDNHIIDVLHFGAASDSAAIIKVRPDISGASRELWNLDRKVMKFASRVFPVAAQEPIDRIDTMITVDRRRRWNPLASHCEIASSVVAAVTLGRSLAAVPVKNQLAESE